LIVSHASPSGFVKTKAPDGSVRPNAGVELPLYARVACEELEVKLGGRLMDRDEKGGDNKGELHFGGS
jgi:hypothetical protein